MWAWWTESRVFGLCPRHWRQWSAIKFDLGVNEREDAGKKLYWYSGLQTERARWTGLPTIKIAAAAAADDNDDGQNEGSSQDCNHCYRISSSLKWSKWGPTPNLMPFFPTEQCELRVRWISRDTRITLLLRKPWIKGSCGLVYLELWVKWRDLEEKIT